RIRSRLRLRHVRGSALVPAERVSAVGRLRRCDRRTAAAPGRSLRPVPCSPGGARVRRPLLELGVPVLLIVATALIAGALSRAHQLEFENALVMTTIVVALYVFVGNSGVISFGHVSFVAVGAYLAGILTVDPQTKHFTMPSLFHVLQHSHIGTPFSLALAAMAGGVYALLIGLPLMRLSGLPAGIATFAVLGIT